MDEGGEIEGEREGYIIARFARYWNLRNDHLKTGGIEFGNGMKWISRKIGSSKLRIRFVIRVAEYEWIRLIWLGLEEDEFFHLKYNSKVLD